MKSLIIALINNPKISKAYETVNRMEKFYTLQRQHLRPFTISVPNAGKNIRNSLPKQWIMQINDAHVDVDVEPRSPTISATASIPPSSPILSSDRPPNRTNSLRVRGILNI